ncbi:hypothetical protein Cni_G13618 [Canna indica]|uniref:Phosphotransferase n=1 Tax=Canna indica TaxID=4628 RepID=A0AAQ3Q9Z7_9LILI|nr:hypothetical protein Cni_G13618 [Canna indica]
MMKVQIKMIKTSLMDAMHDYDSLDLRKVERILEESLQMLGVSLKARMLIVRICDIVTRRAARLATAGIAGILKKIDRDGSGRETSGRMKHKPRRDERKNETQIKENSQLQLLNLLQDVLDM